MQRTVAAAGRLLPTPVGFTGRLMLQSPLSRRAPRPRRADTGASLHRSPGRTGQKASQDAFCIARYSHVRRVREPETRNTHPKKCRKAFRPRQNATRFSRESREFSRFPKIPKIHPDFETHNLPQCGDGVGRGLPGGRCGLPDFFSFFFEFEFPRESVQLASAPRMYCLVLQDSRILIHISSLARIETDAHLLIPEVVHLSISTLRVRLPFSLSFPVFTALGEERKTDRISIIGIDLCPRRPPPPPGMRIPLPEGSRRCCRKSKKPCTVAERAIPDFSEIYATSQKLTGNPPISRRALMSCVGRGNLRHPPLPLNPRHALWCPRKSEKPS